MSNNTAAAPDELPSLDTVYSAIRHWRANKQDYEEPGIPASIWQAIFRLEDTGVSSSELRRLFSLNSQQYKKKRNQYESPSSGAESVVAEKENTSMSPAGEAAPLFAEVVAEEPVIQAGVPPLTVRAKSTKQAVKQLRASDNNASSYVSNATVIVECIREDGQRLKIHMTTCHVDTLVSNFFDKGVLAV